MLRVRLADAGALDLHALRQVTHVVLDGATTMPCVAASSPLLRPSPDVEAAAAAAGMQQHEQQRGRERRRRAASDADRCRASSLRWSNSSTRLADRSRSRSRSPGAARSRRSCASLSPRRDATVAAAIAPTTAFPRVSELASVIELIFRTAARLQRLDFVSCAVARDAFDLLAPHPTTAPLAAVARIDFVRCSVVADAALEALCIRVPTLKHVSLAQSAHRVSADTYAHCAAYFDFDAATQTRFESAGGGVERECAHVKAPPLEALFAGAALR